MTIRTMDIEDFEKIYDLWIHTEGMGKSYDDYRELERELNLIHFAYDGLKIRL